MSFGRYGAIPATRGIRRRPPGSPPVDVVAQPPNNEKMEQRVTELEKAVLQINSTLPHLVTRGDLHKEMNAQTWRFVTFVTSFVSIAGAILTAVVYYLARHI